MGSDDRQRLARLVEGVVAADLESDRDAEDLPSVLSAQRLVEQALHAETPPALSSVLSAAISQAVKSR